MGILGAILVAIAGGSYAISLDFSQTSIQGDTITTIANNLNIDVNDLRAICDEIEIDQKFKSACDALRLIP